MVITVKHTTLDTNNDGTIDDNEWKAFLKKNPQIKPDETIQIMDGSTELMKGTSSELSGKVSDAGGSTSPTAKADKELETIQKKMDELLGKLEKMKEGATKEKLKAALQKEIAKAEKLNVQAGKPVKLSAYKKAAGKTSTQSANFKATTAGSAKGKGGGTGGAKAASAGAAGSKATGAGTSFSPPAGWGAKSNTVSFPSSAAYLSAMNIEGDIREGMDDINKNQNRGKELMRLFFYFSRMAQSGDMGAMYQFMKFLTYIISKDKAKQQIDMGKKLIQLQDLSRKWTSKLMNLDSSDPDASGEMMKQMTLVKSETDAIATSQKLISQMMEEFAQVVESLTNSTKAALDAYGRILRTVSQAR